MAASGTSRPDPTRSVAEGSVPSVSDYRQQAAARERWRSALAGLAVVVTVLLVFWLLPA